VKIEAMFAAAKETDFPSSPWTGFFQLSGRRIPEDLQLQFDGGVVTGAGWDRNGDFIIKGCYDLDSREVRWTKKYGDGRKVLYRGFREGRGIWGTWRIEAGAHAGFMVWPV
jgi:hypothetical protein